MKNKTVVISTLLCLSPIILSLLMYRGLPEQIAIHFDHAGTPDNYLHKGMAAFGLPFLFAAINLYSHFRIAKDPKAENAAAALRAFTGWVIPCLSLIVIPITLLKAAGKQIPVEMIATAIAGLLLIICGNYLPKCKRNYTVGIKLPWTLDSENNWNHTHRFAGFVWVAGGFIVTVGAFMKIPYLFAAMTPVLVLLPPVYSYLFYSRNGGDSEAE